MKSRISKVFRSVQRCVEALEHLEPHEQRANLDYLFDRFVEQPHRDRRAAATAKVQEWRAANQERLAKLIGEANAARSPAKLA